MPTTAKTSFPRRAAATSGFVASHLRTRALRRSLLATVAGAFLALAPGAGAAGSCDGSFGSFSAATPPAACWTPFNSGSPFNTQIPAGSPSASDSSAIVSHMLRYTYRFEGDGQHFRFHSQGSRPIYWSKPTDPLVTVHCTAEWGPGTCQGANGQVIDNIQIHIPAGAQPQNSWDHHMVVVDQQNNVEYDFERASWSGPHELTVWSGSQIPAAGPDATGLGGNADAGSFGLLAGIVRASEFRSNSINHALAISVPCTQGYVWPAKGPWGLDCGQDSQSSSDAPHMGTLLQLQMSDAQIAATGAPQWQQAIMRAMSHYGLYINDTNGSDDPQEIGLEREDDIAYTSLGQPARMAAAVQAVGGTAAGSEGFAVAGVRIDVSKLRVVDPCIVQRTCSPQPVSTTPPSTTPSTTPGSSPTSSAGGAPTRSTPTRRGKAASVTSARRRRTAHAAVLRHATTRHRVARHHKRRHHRRHHVRHLRTAR
jgi:hypothetical protein